MTTDLPPYTVFMQGLARVALTAAIMAALVRLFAALIGPVLGSLHG